MGHLAFQETHHGTPDTEVKKGTSREIRNSWQLYTNLKGKGLANRKKDYVKQYFETAVSAIYGRPIGQLYDGAEPSVERCSTAFLQGFPIAINVRTFCES
jgi:hypothetical protein